MPRLGVIGECMLEFRQADDGSYSLGYGGDAFNTAVYAVRLGLDVGFISAVGDDYYSDWLQQQWQNEGVDCEHVRIIEYGSPALYIIRNDSQGERYFHYWRDASPFRALLNDLDPAQFVLMLGHYDLIYFTGIGLALLAPPQRQMLLQCVSEFRKSGGRVAFDPNYRPILWVNRADAVQWIDRAYDLADTILPSVDDEMALRQIQVESATEASLHDLGIEEVVVKAGERGCSVSCHSETANYPLKISLKPVDTTAAGDSFNAAYLHGRLTGGSIAQAVSAAQALAAKVIMHSGAIISKEQMQ